MEKEEVTTPETIPDSVDVAPSGGTGADTQQDVVNVKDVLNDVLGKNFESDEAALKAVKDTFNFVGSMGVARRAVDAVKKAHNTDEAGAIKIMEEKSQPQEKQPEVDTSKFVSRGEFENAMFLKDHPEYMPYKDIIDMASKAEDGKSYAEVVALDSVKTLISKAQGYDQTESAKSVIMSNPRLGQVADKLQNARDASSKGDLKAAEEFAVGAVLDAIEP